MKVPCLKPHPQSSAKNRKYWGFTNRIALSVSCAMVRSRLLGLLLGLILGMGLCTRSAHTTGLPPTAPLTA